MTEALFPLALLIIGVGAGYFFTRSRRARRYGVIAAAALFATPIILFIVANARDSETLAWVAGIGMMMLWACAMVLGVGALVGWFLAQRSLKAQPAARAAAPLQTPTSATPVRIDIRNLSPEQRRTLLVALSGPALLWVVITIGFWINEPYTPGLLVAGFLPALIVVITAFVMAARHMHANFRMPSFSIGAAVRNARERARSMAEHKAWLAKIAADPQRQRYYAMIQAGDVFWTPERVEYDLDPRSTACCQHLSPIEGAMREAGIHVKLSGQAYVIADCRIDAERLQRRFRFMEPATYQEFMTYDRGAEDPVAHIVCECRSAISVLHPQRAPDASPVFPLS